MDAMRMILPMLDFDISKSQLLSLGIILHMRTLNHPMGIEPRSRIDSFGDAQSFAFFCVLVYR